MTNEHYVDHEVRIRLLEKSIEGVDNKMNVGLTLIVVSIIAPILLKWLGWV